MVLGKIRNLQPRKTLVQIESFKLSIYRKKCWENKSRYIPSIIITYHCYRRITLLLFFTYQMTKEWLFQYNQMLHTFFSFICTFRESILLQKSCHLAILWKCYKLGGSSAHSGAPHMLQTHSLFTDDLLTENMQRRCYDHLKHLTWRVFLE